MTFATQLPLDGLQQNIWRTPTGTLLQLGDGSGQHPEVVMRYDFAKGGHLMEPLILALEGANAGILLTAGHFPNGGLVAIDVTPNFLH